MGRRMAKWKPWQLIFLGYLLLLNIVVLGALGYFMLRLGPDRFLALVAGQAGAGPTELASAAVQTTPSPSPTVSPTPIPPLNIPPAPVPTPTPAPATRVAAAIPTATSTPTRTPRPTATATSTPTRTPRPTATATSTPTRTPRPTARLVETEHSGTPVARGVQPAGEFSSRTEPPATQDPASMLVEARPVSPLKAIPLTNGSIALDWSTLKAAAPYHIYSDMGTGYGVYIFKAAVRQPTYLDEMLRPAAIYRYRILQPAAGEKEVLAQAQAFTFEGETALSILSKSFAAQAQRAPAPAPTALPPNAVLLGLLSDHNYADSFNTLTIVGEVRNDSPVPVGQAVINVVFYDTQGNVIDTARGETLLDILGPGETSPFVITLTRPPGLDSYSLTAVAQPAEARLAPQLAVIEERRFEDAVGFFHVKGTVENVGDTTARRVKVAAVIYGRDGQVINVGFTYVDPPTLPPGQQARYDVIFSYYPRYYSQKVIVFEE